MHSSDEPVVDLAVRAPRTLFVARRPVVTHVGLLLGSLLAAVVMLELFLRLLYSPPVRFLYPQERYDLDPEIGHALRPGQTAFTHDRQVRTNSLGLRHGEIAPEPARGTLRVLALGDSQTFGNGLDLSETWPKQLEQMLEIRGGYRWEVVNGGIPGTDTWQHEILLRRHLDTIHPQAVVLALYVNDVVPRPEPRNVDMSGQTNTSGKRLVYLLKRTSVVTWIYYRLLPRWHAWRLERGSSAEDALLAGGGNDVAERGWRQVEHSLTAMKALCDARKVMLLLAVLPRRDQVSGNNLGRAYNERVRAVAETHGIEALDLLPDLSAAYRLRGDTLFIPWDGHNSAAANHVIAAGLTPRLAGLPIRLGWRFMGGPTRQSLSVGWTTSDR
jgi:lysophospholipase L1-like esterase